MARNLRDRIRWDLEQVRQELRQVVEPVIDLDYAPREDMKSYRGLLQEIGAMEAESAITLNTGMVPQWEDAAAMVSGTSATELLASLDAIRQRTLQFLDRADEEQFNRPIPLLAEWEQQLGDREWEPEEFLRWIVRHEYYHLGQIITYRWVQGNNPYRPATQVSPAA